MLNKLYLIGFFFLAIVFTLSGCKQKIADKGFSVTAESEAGTEDAGESKPGIVRDSTLFATRPSNVLLTDNPRIRITTIYKINYYKDSTTFTGNNEFHFNYTWMGNSEGNQWNSHLLPGFESVYGYNLVNVGHYDTQSQERKRFFPRPVLIKTLYFPSFSRDTLNNAPVHRDYFMISAYDEDTSKDGYINVSDLRRLYYFDIHGEKRRNLVPDDYSVYKSEYDPGNDYVYIFAQHDDNKNGTIDAGETDHIFWIDLKNPSLTGRQY